MSRAAVAVAAAVLAGAAGSPAAAEPEAPAVVVTGLQPRVGEVEFLLAGRNLPAGATLARSAVTVTAAGRPLTSTVRGVAASGTPAPASAVVLVIDASGSMAGARIAAARAAAADYAATAPATVSLGLVTVSDEPAAALAPTGDRAAFAAAVGRLAAGGETALYDGIRLAIDLLDPRREPSAARYVERRIVVLSDGADTASGATAGEAAGEGTGRRGRSVPTIDAVAFGGGADRAALTDICAATGGHVTGANDPAALRSAFRSMAAGLSAPVIVSATVPPELAGRSTSLRVRVDAGAARAAAEVPVTFRPDPRAAPAQTRFTAAGGGMGFATTVSLVAAAGFVAALLLLVPPAGPGRIRRRLRELDSFTGGASRPAAAGGGHVLRAVLAVSEQTVARPGHRERVELALDRAGLSLRAAEWQLVRLGCALAGAVALCLLVPWWCGIPAGLFMGWLSAGRFLRWRAGRRTRAFGDQLPDTLQLVVGSLRSGFSLGQSIDAVVREGAAPVSGELGRALAETRLGGDLEDALERVGLRNANQDMAWLVMAIRIQREVGGNLSEVLETAVETMRERARLGRHVRALSAEGRLSALILMAMPILLGCWMFAFRRDYLYPLYTEPLGILMLGTAVVMMVVGGLWLRKIIEVRV